MEKMYTMVQILENGTVLDNCTWCGTKEQLQRQFKVYRKQNKKMGGHITYKMREVREGENLRPIR